MEESSGEATGLPPETIRVLVVDDDKGVREMFLYALQKRGWYARGAEDGLQALRRLQDEAFTVVVTDLQMPRMDGLALLREMRRTRSLLPVVIQTTLLDRSLEEMLQQAGAFRVLMKGGPLGFLVQSVKDASKAYAGRPA
ncbi:MAG TPA: response regulator [Candidatus Methylomirabilis sp.]|nr:response regulator [Candidatus Methylomirabilis sp.]